jgi:hypothetical protein
MANDPKTFRINDVENPDRLEEFNESLKTAGQAPSTVIRHLCDAYMRFVQQHGHGPTFPVQIVPFEKPKAMRRK